MIGAMRHLRSLPHVIYVLRGPSGCYVGATTGLARRLNQHRILSKPARWRRQDRHLAIHDALRADGFERYEASVVASARGLYDALATEQAVIAQLKIEGERLFNRTPGPRPGVRRAQRAA